MSTPWTEAEKKLILETSPELSTMNATAYRAIVARLNYLAQDTPDIQFVTQEVSGRMAKPRENDWKAL